MAPDEGGFARQPAKPPADSTDSTDVNTHARPAKSGLAGWRAQFKAWRRRRPFWASVFAILGGAEILYVESAPFNVVVHFGLVGQLGYAVPVLIILCGILLMFTPQPRAFYASLILVLGLASWLTSNLGGFFLGMLLSLLGGALGLSWTTAPKQPKARSRPASG